MCHQGLWVATLALKLYLMIIPVARHFLASHLLMEALLAAFGALILERWLGRDYSKKVLAVVFAALLFFVALLYGGPDNGAEPDHTGCTWDGCS